VAISGFGPAVTRGLTEHRTGAILSKQPRGKGLEIMTAQESDAISQKPQRKEGLSSLEQQNDERSRKKVI